MLFVASICDYFVCRQQRQQKKQQKKQQHKQQKQQKQQQIEPSISPVNRPYRSPMQLPVALSTQVLWDQRRRNCYLAAQHHWSLLCGFPAAIWMHNNVDSEVKKGPSHEALFERCNARAV
jgi:hypothetical protein